MLRRSLFLTPLENFLGITRTQLSLIPSVALVSFTIGMVTHQAFIARFKIRVIYVGLVTCAVLGHLLFAIFPSYFALMIGYALLFGYAGGIGYCISLALAREASPKANGVFVGWMVGAFAATGLGMSLTAAWTGISERMDIVFGGLAGGLSLVGFVGYSMLPNRIPALEASKVGGPKLKDDLHEIGPYIFAFFAICYSSLAFVGHGTPIFVEHNASSEIANLAPFLFNIGYIIGAVGAGYLLGYWSDKFALLALLLLAFASSVGIAVPIQVLVLVPLGTFMGAVLGASPTILFVMLAKNRTTRHATRLFGLINLSYGAAGLFGPFISGWLYDVTLSYSSAFLLGAGLLVIAAVATIYLVR
jgi:MFS transporter, OFA family, oxalate/formate antiporter